MNIQKLLSATFKLVFGLHTPAVIHIHTGIKHTESTENKIQKHLFQTSERYVGFQFL